MIRVPRSNITSAISVGQIMRRVINTGKITSKDKFVFLSALASDEELSTEDMLVLSDLMRRMDMGLVKVVVDE